LPTQIGKPSVLFFFSAGCGTCGPAAHTCNAWPATPAASPAPSSPPPAPTSSTTGCPRLLDAGRPGDGGLARLAATAITDQQLAVVLTAAGLITAITLTAALTRHRTHIGTTDTGTGTTEEPEPTRPAAHRG
jgi:hypothetical protein